MKKSIADQMYEITDHIETVVAPQSALVGKRLMQADMTKVVTAAIVYAQTQAEDDMCALDKLAQAVAKLEDDHGGLKFEVKRLTEDNDDLRAEIAALKLRGAMVG